MLSAVEIPIDVQPNMLDAINNCARSMAKNSHNVGSKVLPMIVSIDATNYVGADNVHVDVVLRESMEGTVGPRELLSSKESVKAPQ